VFIAGVISMLIFLMAGAYAFSAKRQKTVFATIVLAGCIVSCAVSVTALVLGVVDVEAREKELLDRFEPHLDEWASSELLKNPAGAEPIYQTIPAAEYPGKPNPGISLRGKAVIICKDENGWCVSPIQFLLDADRRAQMPEEVGTIIRIEWRTDVKAKYTDGSKATETTCTLKIIQKLPPVHVATVVFLPEKITPPQTIKSRRPPQSGVEARTICQYIKQIPLH